MDEKSDLEAALAVVDQHIANATRRAADLERAVGAMLSLNADTKAADKALALTYEALGIYARRRDTMLKQLKAYRGWSG